MNTSILAFHGLWAKGLLFIHLISVNIVLQLSAKYSEIVLEAFSNLFKLGEKNQVVGLLLASDGRSQTLRVHLKISGLNSSSLSNDWLTSDGHSGGDGARMLQEKLGRKYNSY